MVQLAEEQGILHPGDTILEPSSGNTGIGLALVAKLRGYKLRIVMPENVSIERRQLLDIFGVEIIDSPAEEGSNGAIRLSEKLAADDPSLVTLFQYGNPANPLAHYEGTGPEIWRDCPEVDVFVAGLGTSGTLMGVGRYLKEQNPEVKIVAVEPPAGELVQGLRSLDDGFVPPIFDPAVLDRKFIVRPRESIEWLRRLLAGLRRVRRRVVGCGGGRRREDGGADGCGHDRGAPARRGVEVPLVGRVDRRPRRGRRARDPHQLLVGTARGDRSLRDRPRSPPPSTVLRAGGLVAFPTETVYGLGADASQPDAVRRVFTVKGRPADHPVIVHLADADDAGGVGGRGPARRRAPHRAVLARARSPSCVRRAADVPDEVTGGLETVGLRVPDQPVALALLREFAKEGAGGDRRAVGQSVRAGEPHHRGRRARRPRRGRRPRARRRRVPRRGGVHHRRLHR